MTTQLAREFDRFLFPTEEDTMSGGCYHQLPSRMKSSTPERPDMYILSKANSHLFMPVMVSKMVSDRTAFDAALEETIAYAITCLEGSIGSSSSVILGLPMTRQKAQLLVCIGCAGKMLVMQVCEAHFTSINLKSFLCTVYGCVHSLLKRPIMTEEPCVTTLKCDGQHTLLSWSSRVFKCHSTGKVHKLYDNEEFYQCSPQYEFIKSLGEHALPGVQHSNLSQDGRFQMLEYDFVEGTDEPDSISQVATIIKILGKIHDEDYVHSDIRKENVLFCDDGRAYIIDFDLMNKVDVEYSPTYNHDIPERHRDARPYRPRKKDHDRHALHVLLEGSEWFQSLSQARKELLDKLKGQEELSVIANALLH